MAEAAARSLAERVEHVSLAEATRQGRLVHYLASGSEDRRPGAGHRRRDDITKGMGCVLTVVEPCWTFDIHRNRERSRSVLTAALARQLDLT